jgi:hypothetical protein
MHFDDVLPGSNPPAAAPGQPGPAQPDNALFKKAGGDWNKAGESYFHAVSKIGELHGAVQERETRIQQLETALGVGGRPAAADPLTRLQTEFGLPTEPFAEAIDARAGALVERKLKELLGPIAQQMEAADQLASEIDNFDQLQGEARKYMREHPEVSETFKAVQAVNPAAAWKYAIRETAIAKGAKPAGNPPPGSGLPGGMTPQGRSPVNPDGPEQQTREAEALEYGRAYGDMSAYRSERFKGTSVERAVKQALRQAGMLPEGGDSQGW